MDIKCLRKREWLNSETIVGEESNSIGNNVNGLATNQMKQNINAQQPLGTVVVDKSLLVAMTDAERSKLRDVLARHENDVVLDAFIANANATITVQNLRCVQEEQWLNSETINAYVQMIEVAALTAGCNVTSFNSFFFEKISKQVNIGRLQLTPHTSHLTPHTSHTSHLTPHTSHLIGC
jgi:Ulp1 family protease